MDYVEKQPVRMTVASILRSAILSGEFVDGQELSLTDTAARLKVSRTPVREAFQQLATEGLIELRMNREAVVRSIDAEFVADHFTVRGIVEGEAVALAVERKMDVQPLVRMQEAVVAKGDSLGDAEYDSYNQEFHQAIWRGTGSRKLHAILEALWNGPSYSHTAGSIVDHPASVREHGQIILCMQRGDAAGGREVMRRHMRRSMELVLKTLKTGKSR